MNFIKTLKTQAIVKVARMPQLFYSVYSLSRVHKKLLINANTDLVIEGFPRSGNTFAVFAFQSVNKGVKIAHHLHAQPQVLRAIELGVPVCLLIRKPIDAVSSLLVRHPYLSPKLVLRYYLNFYSDLYDVRGQCVVADFDDVISDFGGVVSCINQKYNRNFQLFEHSPKKIDAVFKEIEEINHLVDRGKSTTVAAPHADKEKLKSKLIFTREENLLLEQANKIYRQYTEKN